MRRAHASRCRRDTRNCAGGLGQKRQAGSRRTEPTSEETLRLVHHAENHGVKVSPFFARKPRPRWRADSSDIKASQRGAVTRSDQILFKGVDALTVVVAVVSIV